MKKLYTLVPLLIGFILLQSFNVPDEKNIKRVMKDYRHEQGFMLIAIPACVVRPFIPDEEQIAKDLMKNIKMVRVLVGEEVENSVAGELAHDMKNFLSSGRYKDFLEVITPDEKITIKGCEKNGVLTELVIFVNSPNESVVVQVTGNFVLQDLANSAKLLADL